MARQTYADNVDANGKVFKTVGDNIRMGARAGELIDFSTITDKLDALEPEISALQADVAENEKGIKQNSDGISLLNEDLVNINSKFQVTILSDNILDRSLIKYNKLIDSLGNIVDAESATSGVWYGEVKPNTRYYFCRKNSQGIYIPFQGRAAQYDFNGSVISGTVSGTTGENTYDITTTPETKYIAKYNGSVSWGEAESAPMLIKNWNGSRPLAYEPFNANIKLKQEFYNKPEQYSKWFGCNAVFYGDSITAQGNNINKPNGEYGFQKYFREFFKPKNMYCRGVGGQKFVWNNGHWYCDENGEYTGRPGVNGLTEPPTGSTEHLGCFASWDRITKSIPENIRETIDLVVVMGGTNDIAGIEDVGGSGELSFIEPTWITDGINDIKWTQSNLYKGGDYNTSKFCDAIASTIMKWKVWCPNATVILVTPFVYFVDNLCYKNENGVTFRDMCDVELKTSKYFGNPCGDANMLCNIMPFEQSLYTVDGIHPNEAGKKKLGNAIINILMNYNGYVN